MAGSYLLPILQYCVGVVKLTDTQLKELNHSLLSHMRQHKNKIQEKYTTYTYIKHKTVKQTGREQSHICFYSPAAEHHRPSVGTHCAYPRRDVQAELTEVNHRLTSANLEIDIKIIV